ncbi:MAG: hypothetical protein GY855_06115, partial [candidate division Zixibacteria bacterium]|nr:hypothetical protein [candidate division Zixibacteria bacterium]
MKSIVTVLIILAAALIMFGTISAQTGAWIEHAITPFGSGTKLYGCGETIGAFTFEDADKILFFSINNSSWLEVEMPSTQHFYDLKTEGDLAFAFTDSFIIAYSGISGNCSMLRYEGTPLNISGSDPLRSYVCGGSLAMFITDAWVYIFDIQLDNWHNYSYELPSDISSNCYYWINNDYAAAILPVADGGSPTNLAYSQQLHSFAQTAIGIQWHGSQYDLREMDNGFAGYYDGGSNFPGRYVVGYSAITNSFSHVNVPDDYILTGGTMSPDNYADEFTVYAASDYKVITPYVLARINLYWYDTRLTCWSIRNLEVDLTEHTWVTPWRLGGRFASSYTRHQDNRLVFHIYSGLTGDFSIYDPGIYHSPLDNDAIEGGLVCAYGDNEHVWAHCIDPCGTFYIPIDRDLYGSNNSMAGKNFLTFCRSDDYGSDTSSVYFYNGLSNNWNSINLPNVGNGFNAGLNVFICITTGDDKKAVFYSAHNNTITTVDFSTTFSYFANDNIGIASSGDQTTIFDARTDFIHTSDYIFNNISFGENVILAKNLNTNMLMGYSALSGQVTEYQIDAAPNTWATLNYVGLAFSYSPTLFYAFNGFHDTWVELNPAYNTNDYSVGGKTAIVFNPNFAYGFDPEVPITNIEDADEHNQNIPIRFTLVQTYPKP